MIVSVSQLTRPRPEAGFPQLYCSASILGYLASSTPVCGSEASSIPSDIILVYRSLIDMHGNSLTLSSCSSDEMIYNFAVMCMELYMN
jgi:hypothetical protein